MKALKRKSRPRLPREVVLQVTGECSPSEVMRFSPCVASRLPAAGRREKAAAGRNLAERAPASEASG